MTVKREREELKRLLEAAKNLITPPSQKEQKEVQSATTQKGRG